MKPPFVRNPYNYDMSAASNETGLRCKDETLTKQAFAEESDINTIVKRFGLTGQLPEGLRAPQYGDFTEIGDFHQAMQAVREAQESFMQLPPNIRARFHNDPQELLEFCADNDNYDEAKKMGLVVPQVLPEAQKASTGSPDEPGTAKKTPPPEAGKGG